MSGVRRFRFLLFVLRRCIYRHAMCGANFTAARGSQSSHAMQPSPQMAAHRAPTTAANGAAADIADAENIAIQNHPRIQAATQLASAAAAQVKEVQSIYYPQANGLGYRRLCRNKQPHIRGIFEQSCDLQQICRRRSR